MWYIAWYLASTTSIDTRYQTAKRLTNPQRGGGYSDIFDKLAINKCNDVAFNLSTSYVSNRQQVVDSGEGSSKPSIIKSGVHIRNHFINDLPLLLDYCFIDLFADDATYHTVVLRLKATPSSLRVHY